MCGGSGGGEGGAGGGWGPETVLGKLSSGRVSRLFSVPVGLGVDIIVWMISSPGTRHLFLSFEVSE